MTDKPMLDRVRELDTYMFRIGRAFAKRNTPATPAAKAEHARQASTVKALLDQEKRKVEIETGVTSG